MTDPQNADDGSHRPEQSDNGPEEGMEPLPQDPNWVPEVAE